MPIVVNGAFFSLQLKFEEKLVDHNASNASIGGNYDKKMTIRSL